MDWASVAEVVKVLAPVGTAGAAWFAASIAYRGLSKWREETVGKRRAELAEEVLADFYQARDIINAARSSCGFGHEGATRQKAEWENEDDTQTLNAYYRTFERLNKQHEFFAQLHARRYRFIAHFGSTAAQPYDQLHGVYVRIVTAVEMLLRTYRHTPPSRQKWETTIGWATTDNDPIPGELDLMVQAVEKICRPAIQEAAK